MVDGNPLDLLQDVTIDLALQRELAQLLTTLRREGRQQSGLDARQWGSRSILAVVGDCYSASLPTNLGGGIRRFEAAS
jgi:hypothetical protein